jgi:hypothetical protein
LRVRGTAVLALLARVARRRDVLPGVAAAEDLVLVGDLVVRRREIVLAGR